VKPGSRRK